MNTVTLAPPRIPFMLTMMTIGVALLIFDSLSDHGWLSASVWGYGLFAGYSAYALLTRDAVVGRLVAFALVAGLAELGADYYLVDVTHTLVYPRPEPMLLASPAYMPFSWAVVLTQIGFIGWLLLTRLSAWRTGLLLVPVSGILIPLYENWAIHAGWWNYQHTPEWLGVPYYIYLAEALLIFPVPFFVQQATVRGWKWVILGGLLEGVTMWLACVLAIKLVG